MGRKLLVMLLSALLVLGTVSAGSAQRTRTVTLAGVLEAVDTPSVPHLEVGGYVLLTTEMETLLPYVGREVVVTGTEFDGPSVYMKQAVDVAAVLTPAPESKPIVGAPVSDPDSDPTTGGALVTVPTQPISLFGTSFYLLFGKVDRTVSADGDQYFILLANGTEKVPVTSLTVDLATLAGQTVAAVAVAPPAGGPMRLLFAVILDQDLSTLLGPGSGMVYVAPPLPITVQMRGQTVEFDQQPIVGNGRTLIGLRAVGETLGAEVQWDAATKTAAVTRGDRTVLTTLGNNHVTLRQAGAADVIIVSDVAPVVVGGRMMVPLRVLSEGLGLQVSWNQQTRTVVLD